MRSPLLWFLFSFHLRRADWLWVHIKDQASHEYSPWPRRWERWRYAIDFVKFSSVSHHIDRLKYRARRCAEGQDTIFGFTYDAEVEGRGSQRAVLEYHQLLREEQTQDPWINAGFRGLLTAMNYAPITGWNIRFEHPHTPWRPFYSSKSGVAFACIFGLTSANFKDANLRSCYCIVFIFEFSLMHLIAATVLAYKRLCFDDLICTSEIALLSADSSGSST